jgi:hypothetical protein
MRIAAITAALTTAAFVTLSSTSAYASGTVITVGGSSAPASVPVIMTNTSAVTFDTDYGVPMTCTDSDIDGTIYRGAAVSTGNTIGTIDSLTLSDCTATTFGFDVEVSMSGQDITVRNATGVNAGDPIPIDIQVDATVTGTFCNFTAEGSVRGVLNPGSGSPDGTIELQPGYDLTIDTAGGSPSGASCGGEIYAGDLAQATGGDFDLTTTGPNAGPINHS